MKVKNWLKNNNYDFSVTNNNTTIISSDDIKFMLNVKYGSFEVPEDNIEDNNYLYNSYRTMIKSKIVLLNEVMNLINSYDPIEDSETETVTTEYGSEISESGTLTENNTTTNNITVSNTGTDNHSIQNNETKNFYPMGGSNYTAMPENTVATTGSDNQTVNLQTSNTGTIGVTKNNTDSKNTEKSGTDTITREKTWTNNDLYDELMRNRFEYNKDFSLIEYYLDGFKSLVLYIDNDVWG